MNHRRDYEIAFVGLKPGVHVFNYDLDETFFSAFGEQDFNKPKAYIKLSLDKQTSFMLLHFEVGGSVELLCDRCGNNLPFELWDEFEILVKMVEDPEQMNLEEGDPDVYYISRTESHIDVKNWLYEFVNLSIPFQKSCTEEEIGGPQCNKEVLEKLKMLTPEQNETKNPVWKGLDKFKDTKN
ncbi:MAG TPA: DUF177 domain-containing protein [Chitinophagaceae bacterium]|nr:DUF177 domain-containing protein [Chitinophagaceae bacterium]